MLSLTTITDHVIQSQTHTVTHDTLEHRPHCSGKPTDIQQHSETQTLVSEFIQVCPKLRFCRTCSYCFLSTAGSFMALCSHVHVFERLWHGCRLVGLCFCCFEERGKKVACAVPISLCSIRKWLPIWASLCDRWMVNVERRGCWLQPLSGVTGVREGPCFQNVQ